MSEPERSHLSGKALEVYDRMLERVQTRLHELQETSLQTLEEEVQKAIEVEYEVEEMTREEADLLGAYLQRDLEHLLHFVEETGEGLGEWLQLDIALLEHTLADRLLSVADQIEDRQVFDGTAAELLNEQAGAVAEVSTCQGLEGLSDFSDGRHLRLRVAESAFA